MLLIGVKEEKSWLISRWHLSYHASWQAILKATQAIFAQYDKLQILVDNQVVEVKDKAAIANLQEAGQLTFRGISKILQVPISITFYNQLEEVDVQVAKVKNKFPATVNYEEFNKFAGQYLDSIELAMYR